MKAWACLILAVAVSLAAPAEKITAESVIAGYVKAMGGRKALAQLRTETVIGNVIDETAGKSGSYSLILSSPDRF